MLDVLRELIGDDLRLKRVVAETRLFRQGDATRGLFLLEAGAVRLVRHTPDGNEVILHTARPGESLVEASLFAEHYHCEAVALVDSVVALAPKDRLRVLLRTHPDAAALRLQARGADGAVMLKGTWKDFAAELGLTHETLYRTMAALERAGRLRRRGTRAWLMEMD